MIISNKGFPEPFSFHVGNFKRRRVQHFILITLLEKVWMRSLGCFRVGFRDDPACRGESLSNEGIRIISINLNHSKDSPSNFLGFDAQEMRSAVPAHGNLCFNLQVSHMMMMMISMRRRYTPDDENNT